ncbi:MAG: class I SAM-dependent methyltransferase [Chloroflexi bacterium]|nr:class I SAM-dependent methyltransferase [Chloroflexota bacterium]
MNTNLNGKYVKDYFKSSKTYAATWEPEQISKNRMVYLKERQDVIAITCPQDKTILDIGTGKGRFAIPFALAGARRVVGIDLSEEMLRIARERAELAGVSDRVEFEPGDAETLRFEAASFDVVCCGDAFQYLPNPVKALTEFKRLCRAGGKIVVNVTNSDYSNFMLNVQKLVTKNSAIYHIVRGLYFASILYPARLVLHRFLGWPLVKTERSNQPLIRTYTKQEFEQLFVNAGLTIENNLQYGGKTPMHFWIVARK